MKTNVLKSILPAIAFALLLGGCATEPSLYSGKKSYFGYSWEQELALGSEADGDIVQQMGLYGDDELAEYVKGIGATILQQSAMRQSDAPEIYQGTEFVFRVLDSPVVNAFALPGGFVYVTRGLLAHVQNEAQLAVVIGHEIVHVEARHASQQALKQQWGQIGLLAGAVIGEQVAENKELARQVVQLSGGLFQLATLKYGRDAERESDQRGVEYAAKAGYEASEGSEFFRSLQRISGKSGQSLPTWMSSHPDPGEREVTIKRLAEEWREQGYEMRGVERESYLQRIDGLIVGENPRHGYTEGSRFIHPDLKFQFDVPSGWTVRNENSAVYAVEPSGSAMISFSVAKESDALAAARALQERIQLQPQSAQSERINGLAAHIMEGVVVSGTDTVPVIAAMIEYDSRVFSFIGYGSPTGFAVHRGGIRSSFDTFSELTDQAALNKQPYRIAIVGAPRSAPFQELLPSTLPPGTDPLDWAIMNQVELGDTIEAGYLLKLPATD